MKKSKRIAGVILFLCATAGTLGGCSKNDQKQTDLNVSGVNVSDASVSDASVSDVSVFDAKNIVAENNKEYTINTEGTYTLEGTAENSTVIVDASKNDKIEIILKDATISNDDFPVIYVKSADECMINCMGNSTLSVNKDFKADGSTNTDAVIFSKDDLTLDGTGQLAILSACGNGIASKNDIKMKGGSYTISCKLDGIEAKETVVIEAGTFKLEAESDGIQAKKSLTINGGDIDINAVEGLEATYVQINDGNITINASDDGINASKKSEDYEPLIEINGGNIKIVMGAGDTDGIDSNGTIVVNGGTIDVTGQSAFDSDMGSTFNGGTIIINGTEVDEIPESMMGGHGGQNGFGGGKPGDQNGFDGGGKPGDQNGFDGGGKPGDPNGFDGGGKPGGPNGFDGGGHGRKDNVYN